MFRPRVIPVLLLKQKGLVKTVKFRRPTYIGDPINAVHIFNDLESDELVFLDITATKDGRIPPIDVVRTIGDEAFMPFAVGGGVRSVSEIRQLIQAGAEKVVINTAALDDADLVRRAAEMFGSQSVIVSIDVKKDLFGQYRVYTGSGTKRTGRSPVDHALEMQRAGAGELLVTSIDRDGTMGGYDCKLIRSVADVVDVPVIACGGAGDPLHLREAVTEGGASAAAAGSLFVFQGPRRAVLISYPERKELENLFAPADGTHGDATSPEDQCGSVSAGPVVEQSC